MQNGAFFAICKDLIPLSQPLSAGSGPALIYLYLFGYSAWSFSKCEESPRPPSFLSSSNAMKAALFSLPRFPYNPQYFSSY
jgi:hypothetical protein